MGERCVEMGAIQLERRIEGEAAAHPQSHHVEHLWQVLFQAGLALLFPAPQHPTGQLPALEGSYEPQQKGQCARQESSQTKTKDPTQKAEPKARLCEGGFGYRTCYPSPGCLGLEVLRRAQRRGTPGPFLTRSEEQGLSLHQSQHEASTVISVQLCPHRKSLHLSASAPQGSNPSSSAQKTRCSPEGEGKQSQRVCQEHGAHH